MRIFARIFPIASGPRSGAVRFPAFTALLRDRFGQRVGDVVSEIVIRAGHPVIVISASDGRTDLASSHSPPLLLSRSLAAFRKRAAAAAAFMLGFSPS